MDSVCRSLQERHDETHRTGRAERIIPRLLMWFRGAGFSFAMVMWCDVTVGFGISTDLITERCCGAKAR